MKLSRLVADLGATLLGEDVEVRRVVEDSREVQEGDLFVAVVRDGKDGHAFIDAAVAAGASALCVQKELELSVPQIVVASTAQALGELASALHEHPRAALKSVAITGTNGKTTTSYLIETMIRAAKGSPGVIGTVNYRYGDVVKEAPYTTPTPPILHSTLAEMRDAGCDHAVMETSSAALAMQRLAGLHFDVAVFTNITQDHLDLHGDMETYLAAKALLFQKHLAGSAVINIDDEHGEYMAQAAGESPVLRVSAQGKDGADIRVTESKCDITGVHATIITPKGELKIHSSALLGHYNLENLAVTVGVGVALGLPLEAISSGIAGMEGVPGRVERVPNELGLDVLVDYAHTPDALANVLAALRPLCQGDLICVFGCGGDRDPGKRPKMGAEVAKLADLAVVTSDNPRTEDPKSIIDMILPAVPNPFYVDVDRRSAIRAAVAQASPGDIVVIAGKGHEDYQILGTEKIHFDDREEAAAAMTEKKPATFSAQEVSQITGGSRLERELSVRRVIIDGRKARAGDLYVSIVGEVHDGHDFIAQAGQRGACLALTARGRSVDEIPCIETDDPREALGKLAAEHRKRWRREQTRIIGITGSSGKTTVKALIAAALSAQGPVLSPLGSQNNETGVPLTLLSLSPLHRYAVIEMGMRGLGQIDYLTQMTRPDVAVVVNAGTAHLSELGSLENIAKAKSEIYGGVAEGGISVHPNDHELLSDAAKAAGKTLSFGDSGTADVLATSYARTGPASAQVTLLFEGREAVASIPIPGPHTAKNAACAVAAAIAAGISFEAATQALSRTRVPPMRGEVRHAGGRHILVDCYNANPDSTRAALASIAETGAESPVAILGDMLELGPTAAEDHAKIGQEAARLGIQVVTIGDHAGDISRGVVAAGGKVTQVGSPQDAAQAAWDQSAGGGWVLVKASRGAGLERAVLAFEKLAEAKG